jgi:hypothetical protein
VRTALSSAESVISLTFKPAPRGSDFSEVTMPTSSFISISIGAGFVSGSRGDPKYGIVLELDTGRRAVTKWVRLVSSDVSFDPFVQDLKRNQVLETDELNLKEIPISSIQRTFLALPIALLTATDSEYYDNGNVAIIGVVHGWREDWSRLLSPGDVHQFPMKVYGLNAVHPDELLASLAFKQIFFRNVDPTAYKFQFSAAYENFVRTAGAKRPEEAIVGSSNTMDVPFCGEICLAMLWEFTSADSRLVSFDNNCLKVKYHDWDFLKHLMCQMPVRGPGVEKREYGARFRLNDGYILEAGPPVFKLSLLPVPKAVMTVGFLTLLSHGGLSEVWTNNGNSQTRREYNANQQDRTKCQRCLRLNLSGCVCYSV